MMSGSSAQVDPQEGKTESFAEFESNRNFVMSFARGLEVIQSFYQEPQGMTAARVAKKTGLSRAAVRRFLITLETLGHAENASGVYHLRPSILRIGCSYLSSTSLPALAQPILEQVSEKVHESTSLSALDEDNIIYLARHTSSRVLGGSVGWEPPAGVLHVDGARYASRPAEAAARPVCAPREDEEVDQQDGDQQDWFDEPVGKGSDRSLRAG